MPECLLKVTNISKSFAGVQALKGVSLTINPGEIRCLAGENGCGKSTLIKVISGVYTPDEGEIEINGKKFQNLSPIDSIHEGIQVIYQDFSLFSNLTVAENIAMNSELAKNSKTVSWKRIHATAQEAINKINIKLDLKEKVENLSVADKQLVAISRALLQNAKLIIMDEPTTALTQREVKSLFEVIKGLQKKGIAILFVSHKLDEVFKISEKITILRNGHNVIDGDTSNFDKAKFVYYMTGRQIEEDFYTFESKETKSLLKVENLSKKGGFKDISFELHEGEILGITGLLGSGRTELALSLFGMNPADSGSIYIDGKPVTLKSVQDAAKNGIGYVPEDRLTEGLFHEQSIGRNIVVSILGKLLGKSKLLDKEKMNDVMDNSIKSLNIATPSSKLPVKALSGGNQQRVVLAKWLVNNPKILILNGPTVGVDIGSKTDIHQIIRDLAKKGVGVIIISDDIPEVMHNCSTILIMKKGRIVGKVNNSSTTEEVLDLKLSDI